MEENDVRPSGLSSLRDGAAGASPPKASIPDACETIERILPMLELVTIRQAIEAGYEVVDACGINPWCIREGRAEGDEPALSWWRVDAIRTALKDLKAYAQAIEARRAETGTGSVADESAVTK